MFNNVGTVDRIIRILLAITLTYFGLWAYSGSALGIFLTIAGSVLAISALAGSCLLYRLLGINTRNLQQE
ncbi:hypothetical protein NIES4102_29310 [Chondrocystis sp. NIES-4102]|nr:hypothetical protein NIES4102_29310 [Chondrocystis sp. NIES-4102]